MKKSLLKLAIAATIITGLPGVSGKITSRGGKVKMAIAKPYYYFTDYINRTQIALKPSEAALYKQKKPDALKIDGYDVKAVNNKLSSMPFSHLGYIDKYHGFSVPSGFKDGWAETTYKIGIYSNMKDVTLYTADEIDISASVSITNGLSFGQSFSITTSMSSKVKSDLIEFETNSGYGYTATTTYYYEQTVTKSESVKYKRCDVNGGIYPWSLKKFALYMPIRFEEYSVCTENDCGLARGSYISKVSYKLLQIDSYEVAQVYRVLDGKTNYYFHSSQTGKPMLLEEANSKSGFTAGYISKYL